MGYILSFVRIGFHQGVHELIRDRNARFHSARLVDGTELEVILSGCISAFPVFIGDERRFGHHYLLHLFGQFIHLYLIFDLKF